MKSLLQTIIIGFLYIFVTGWMPIDAKKIQLPSCSESSVTDHVIKYVNKKLYKALLPENLAGQSKKIYYECKDTEVYKEYEKIDYQGVGFAWGTIPVDEFIKFIDVCQPVADINKHIIKQINDLNVKLNAIRVSGKYPNINKIECQAQLSFSNGKSLPIEYSAQITEDNKVWVEVHGL